METAGIGSRDALARALSGALPGAAAQADMAPEYLSCSDLGAPEGCREASVLVLLYPSAGSIRFPLIVRADSTGPHGGQIGLPGGEREGSETPGEAALREAEEELGVEPAAVELLGALSELYVPSSRFRVRPLVGWSAARPRFRPSPAEVAALLEPDLGELLDPANRRSGAREVRGRRWTVPYYQLAGREVWGATARILSELRALLLGAGL